METRHFQLQFYPTNISNNPDKRRMLSKTKSFRKEKLGDYLERHLKRAPQALEERRCLGILTMAKLADPSGSSSSEVGSIDDECSISLCGNCFFKLSLCMSLRDA